MHGPAHVLAERQAAVDVDLACVAGHRLDDRRAGGPDSGSTTVRTGALSVGAELADALHAGVGDEDLGLGPRRAGAELDLVVEDELRAHLLLEVLGERLRRAAGS